MLADFEWQGPADFGASQLISSVLGVALYHFASGTHSPNGLAAIR
jgi:hypothetical protein